MKSKKYKGDFINVKRLLKDLTTHRVNAGKIACLQDYFEIMRIGSFLN